MRRVVVGIDQSYKNTGVSVCIDGKLTLIRSVWLKSLENNSERRNFLKYKLRTLFEKLTNKYGDDSEIVVIIERIRLRSAKQNTNDFINIDYIKGVGALNAIIVDLAKEYSIEVYSVDTRAWKSTIVGSSKPQNNRYGIDPEKWPTIRYVCRLGYEQAILLPVSDRKRKGVIVRDGVRYTYNDDAADSACIALYGFAPKNKQKLLLEH